MNYHVYVIESEKGNRYTGYTSDLERRLREHNDGMTFTTRKGRHWKIIYSESHQTRASAMKREKYLKTGRDFLKNIIHGVEPASADSSSGS